MSHSTDDGIADALAAARELDARFVRTQPADARGLVLSTQVQALVRPSSGVDPDVSYNLVGLSRLTTSLQTLGPCDPLEQRVLDACLLALTGLGLERRATRA